MDVAIDDPIRVYLGTSDGLRVLHLADGGVEELAQGIRDNVVRDIAVHPDDPDDAFVGCGLRGWGLHHSTDGGRTVEEVGFGDRWVWGITRHPHHPETVYVGVEPPMLYETTDNGGTFEPFESIEELGSRSRWTFFHEPFRAGHVHGIAIHPDRPDRIYAGVEHGALIFSHDGGETWVETLVGSDLHRVAVAPDDPSHILAATGAGLYRSRDSGDGWRHVPDLRGRYLHSIQFDPHDPERLVVYADRSEDPLNLSEDGAETWMPIGQGLPATRPADPVRFHPSESDVLVYAGDVSDEESQLYLTANGGRTWEPIGGTFPKIWRLEVSSVD